MPAAAPTTLRKSRALVVIANRSTLMEPRWVRTEVELLHGNILLYSNYLFRISDQWIRLPSEPLEGRDFGITVVRATPVDEKNNTDRTESAHSAATRLKNQNAAVPPIR